jgi:hypothetical protein
MTPNAAVALRPALVTVIAAASVLVPGAGQAQGGDVTCGPDPVTIVGTDGNDILVGTEGSTGR